MTQHPAKTIGALAAAALLAVSWLVSSVANAREASPEAAPLQRVDIVSDDRRLAFEVEVARTPAQKERGLMFRRSLPERGGMLFTYKREREILMWMKNTLIPLDMIFIGANGRIERIARNTEPKSLRLISSGRLARAVLEVRAGTADRLGIDVGDRVILDAGGKSGRSAPQGTPG